MLLERFGLVVNVYCRQKGNHKKNIFSIIHMLRKERKLNHIRGSVKTTNGRKSEKQKQEQRTKQ